MQIVIPVRSIGIDVYIHAGYKSEPHSIEIQECRKIEVIEPFSLLILSIATRPGIL